MDLNKLKQEELIAKLNINQEIMNEVPIGFCITDENGIYEEVNPHYCKIYGYRKKELLGQHFSKVTTHDNLEELNEMHDKFIKSGGEISKEWKVKRKNGEEIIIAATAARIKGIDGTYKKVTYVIDITERKKEEQKLIETKRRLDYEINKAKKLHENTLPMNMPDINKLDIHAYYKPANEIGGDFYNFIKLGDNKLLFYLSDVTGHGLDAAMMSAFVKSTISAYLGFHSLDQIPAPKEIIEFIFKQNQKENFPEGYFITILIGIIDTEVNKIIYSSAGMHVPLVVCNNDLKELEAGNLPISKTIPFELVQYQNKEVKLPQDTIFFITTDGIFEQPNKNGEEYGDRYKDIICQNKHSTAKLIAEEINNDFADFYNGQTTDDITYVIFKFK
ncbi:MAG: SpoIIE family protein phosphatase [Halanaerobium sp.]